MYFLNLEIEEATLLKKVALYRIAIENNIELEKLESLDILTLEEVEAREKRIASIYLEELKESIEAIEDLYYRYFNKEKAIREIVKDKIEYLYYTTIVDNIDYYLLKELDKF